MVTSRCQTVSNAYSAMPRLGLHAALRGPAPAARFHGGVQAAGGGKEQAQAFDKGPRQRPGSIEVFLRLEGAWPAVVGHVRGMVPASRLPDSGRGPPAAGRRPAA